MGLLQGVFDDLIVRLFLFVLIIFAFLRAYFFSVLFPIIIQHLLAVFYVHVTVHRNKFLYNKTNRRINFTNLFWQKKNFYMFRAVPLPIIRSSLTVHLTTSRPCS